MKLDSQNQEENPQERDHKQILLQAAEGLLYPSESDYPFEYFEWENENKENLSKDEVLQILNKPADTPVKSLSLDDFFDNVTKIKDWYEEEEKANAERFVVLKKTLKQNLSDIQVFKVGEIEIDTYIAGKNASGQWEGLSTKVIET